MQIVSDVELLPPLIEPNPTDTIPLLESSSSIQIQNDDQQQQQQQEQDIESDKSSAACCRICLEYDGEPGDDLISPCMCKGTQQFVHRSCLDQWRSVKEGFAFSHCTTCKAQFHLRVETLQDNSWRKTKFGFFVARDVILEFLVFQMMISLLGGFAYLMDKNGNFRSSFSDGWDRVLSKHPVPFYYCIGVMVCFGILSIVGLIIHCVSNNYYLCPNHNPGYLYCYFIGNCAGAIIFVIIFSILGIASGFIIATFSIQIIWQKHYHILNKIELTKEYVVVDLGGCYNPPKLDPEHEERLKLLELL